ncbi:MAG TPA: ABC transporter transmembrane domain-containing protein, partial [Bacilli bacterium]
MSKVKIYWWTISYLKPYRWLVAWLVLCGLLLTSSELVIPKLIQYFIDVILPQEDYRLFGYLLLSFGVICILLFISSMISNVLQRIIREKAARDLQFSVFQNLRKLGFSYYE